jgi:hypothetical protein
MRLRDYIRQGQMDKLRADAQAEREPLPAGKCRLELVNGVLVETDQDEVLELEWRVESGDHAGRSVFQRLKLAGKALPYAVGDLDLIGVPIARLDSRKLPRLARDANGRPGERFRAPVPVGLVVGAFIGHWTGNDGRNRHRIERLVKVLRPAPDLAEFEPESPAADPADAPDQHRGDSDSDWAEGAADEIPF